jgi:F420-dependent oxidoreductase-like protein
MRFGLTIGYSGSRVRLPMDLIEEADRLGFHAVWSAEAYGSDAVTPLAYVAARTTRIGLATGIVQMPARTPAMTAMTMTTLDHLSGGRAICGLGPSGPQVVEGWHGVAYGKPLGRTREYIDVLRQIWAREQPLVHRGEHYQIPYAGPGATGLGKPLKSIVHGRQIPIYVAAVGLKAVAQAAEIADGWLPIFFSPERAPKIYGPLLAEGFAKAGKREDQFDIAVGVAVMIHDDVQKCLDALKPNLALYIGGMGARGKNFYNDLACRYGFDAEAKEIQDLYLAGRKDEAAAKVPNRLVDEVALVGPKERVRDRLAAWKASPVRTINVGTNSVETLRTLAELL